MQASTRRAVVGSPCLYRSGVGRVDFGFAVGDEPDVHRLAFHHALAQPEKHPPVRTEALEVRVAGRAVFAVVIQPPVIPSGVNAAV